MIFVDVQNLIFSVFLIENFVLKVVCTDET